jgi:hypothetical protein
MRSVGGVRGAALRRAVAAAALVVLAAACSSDQSSNDTIPPSTTSTPPAATPATDRPSSSPTVPAATTSPTTPPASAASTDPPASDPKSEIETAVRALYAADEEAWKACLRELPNCDDTPFEATESGPVLGDLKAKIQDRNERQVHARNIDQYRSAAQSVDVMDSLDSAQLVACIDDAVVLFTIDENGHEALVDDTHSSRIESIVVRAGDDGAWRIVSAAVTSESANGAPVCDA